MGARLAEARERRAMTQEQLAERSGSNQARISVFERRNSRSTELLYDLAAALEVNPVWLLTGEGDSWLDSAPPKASTPAEEFFDRYQRAPEASRQAIDILLSEKILQHVVDQKNIKENISSE